MPAVFIIAGIFYLRDFYRYKFVKTKMIILYRLKNPDETLTYSFIEKRIKLKFHFFTMGFRATEN